MTTRNGPSNDAADRVDQDLVARAYRKVMEKQELTKEERRALKRHEVEKEERLRWQYYESIPQKHWREMSGRQTKVLNEQAQRYGIPCGGATINLPEVAKALHNFLAANAAKLAREDDDLLQGESSPALERYREERFLLARLERKERQQKLLPRHEVHELLARIAGIVRGAGDALQRQFGNEAVVLLIEALDDATREMDRYFSAQPSEEEPGEEPDNNRPAAGA